MFTVTNGSNKLFAGYVTGDKFYPIWSDTRPLLLKTKIEANEVKLNLLRNKKKYGLKSVSIKKVVFLKGE